MCHWARHFILCLVLVQPRKTRNSPDMAENCWLGCNASLQTKIFILNKRINPGCEGQINKLSRTPDRDICCFYPCKIILSRIPVLAHGKDKKQTATRRLQAGSMSIRVFIILLKLRHHVTTQCIQDFLEVFFMFFQYEISGEQEKRIHYSCEDGIEKYVPHSSLSKPHDANGWSSGDFSIAPSHSWWILIVPRTTAWLHKAFRLNANNDSNRLPHFYMKLHK